MERTLVLLKPDALQRGLTGEIITRLEARGLKLVAVKLMQMSETLARRHYEAHVDKPFFAGLVQFITSGPLVAIILDGKNAVSVVRSTMGATDPAKSSPGTIRGDLAIDMGRNLIHGSDSPEAAQREIALFFHESEILDYHRDTDPWIIES
jgi:nucleoside-diphosphate kinase